MQNLSEFADSLTNTLNPEHKKTVRSLRSICQALVVAGVLFTAGASTGYFTRDIIAQNRRAVMEDNHREDLRRRDVAYADSLKVMATALENATGKVVKAADTVSVIVEKSEVAVEKAQRAATKADKAIAQSTAAITKATAVPDATREQVNRSVERANRKLP